MLDSMSVEEQISLLAGRDHWTTVPVERLGVGSVKMTDGPNGARGGGTLVGGLKAAAYPVGIALAATWDLDLVREVAADLAREARSKGARVLLAPTVNIHRSTRNGRNFECYSEDPHLTAELAVAYIEGLQSGGVGATIKHFIANESEYQRTTMSSDVDERPLREIYMAPFEAAVKRAKPWAVMTSYNRLNGTYVSERAELLDSVLRREWGFDGLIMSDWHGLKSTVEAVEAGTDLEMPGPASLRGLKLVEAYAQGKASKEAIRERARRVLQFVERAGGVDGVEIAEERAEDRPETRALIRRTGAAAIVLLKNDGALPLAPRAGARIAVIGPSAKTALAMGGGSAQLNPHYLVSPWAALRAALPDVEFVYAQGAENRRLVAAMPGEIEAEFFAGRNAAGPAASAVRAQDGTFMFGGHRGPNVDVADFRAVARSRQTAAVSGDYEFSLVSTGPSHLYVNDEMVVDNRDFRYGDQWFGTASDEVRGRLRLERGATYEIRVEWEAPPHRKDMGLTVLRIGMAPALGPEAIEEAVAIARDADVALVFVGLNGEWDTEGIDRPNLDLPHRQNELVARVAAVNPKTVVVLQSGGPVLTPWLDKVAALMQAWYLGQEVGSAIVDVLTGAAEPGGRLPQSFPRRLEDEPSFLNYPGEGDHVRYGEGVYVGYRFYDKLRIEPLFPFGFGLSYTQFRAGTLRLAESNLAAGGEATASIDVTNIGACAGSTVVQFYVAPEDSSVSRPRKELKGFVKLNLAPGENGLAKVTLDMRAFAYFDAARRAWVAEAGAYALRVGFSSAEIIAEARLELTSDWIDDAPARAWPPGG